MRDFFLPFFAKTEELQIPGDWEPAALALGISFYGDITVKLGEDLDCDSFPIFFPIFAVFLSLLLKANFRLLKKENLACVQ